MSGSPSIGVLDLTMAGWQAGGVVTRTMAHALALAGASVKYVCSEDAVPVGEVPLLRVPPLRSVPLENTVRRVFRWPSRESAAAVMRHDGVDVALPRTLPIKDMPPWGVGWIPDFQHKHLPHLYTRSQLETLERRFTELASVSRVMLFSSEDAAADFRRFYPSHADKARVASFSSLFAFEPSVADPREVSRHFHLPERFLLVVNQFWQHKNHRIVPDALALLKKQGLQVPVVMAGLPSDYRDRQNDSLSETFQAMAAGDVWGDCVILGKLSRIHIEGLLRSATALIQPSRFEGWNTSVEDAKALGCPVFLSDLPVHREQCPDALAFFGCDDPAALAEGIARHWESLSNRPDDSAEARALAEARERAMVYGRKLMEICHEACQ